MMASLTASLTVSLTTSLTSILEQRVDQQVEEATTKLTELTENKIREEQNLGLIRSLDELDVHGFPEPPLVES